MKKNTLKASRNSVLNAEIVTIGDELLKGSTLNTNARFLAEALTAEGFRVQAQSACPDQKTAICDLLQNAMLRSRLIIVSGGLGPTPDDVTRDAIAELFHVPLVFSKSQYSQIQKSFKRHGAIIPVMVRKEALFPQKSVPLVNHFGIALGFSIRYGQGLLIVLPGVPHELKNMYHQKVRPLIHRTFQGFGRRFTLIVKTVGLPELEVMRRLGNDFFDVPFEFGIYPYPGEAALRLYAGNRKITARLRKKIESRLGQDVYAYEEKDLAEKIGELLVKKKKTLAVAESCTGGMLASEITRFSGASRYFAGGVVAYSNALKQSLLGVASFVLRKSGAVSEETALAMAEGVRLRLDSDYGIGITGIAGPGGGSFDKPVGLVCIALSGPRGSRVIQRNFMGDRFQIRQKAMKKSLELLWRDLVGR